MLPADDGTNGTVGRKMGFGDDCPSGEFTRESGTTIYLWLADLAWGSRSALCEPIS